MTINFHQIKEAIFSVTGRRANQLPLHEPIFKGNEWSYVKDCLDSGWVSSVGNYVNRFEQLVSEYTGIPYAVAVVNGTAALHICLKLVGVKEHEEVIMPSLTFVATANAAVYCGATPHFVDSCETDLGIDVVKLEQYLHEIAELKNKACYNKRTGRRIAAVVPMHTFGHAVSLDRLRELCNRLHIALVEDAAEALGTTYQGKHVGKWGHISAISFNGNKIVTTGGGGMIVTVDENLAKLAKHITSTAKLPHRWEYDHDVIGYNYRLPNINAALGCAQMENIENFVNQKRRLTDKYIKAFSEIEYIDVFTEPVDSRSNYWLQTLIIRDSMIAQKDELIQYLNENGIGCRPVWKPMHKLTMFRECPKMENMTCVERLSNSIINIPSSAYL